MANILKDDVQTYVRELIEKEFRSNRVEEKSLSQNPLYAGFFVCVSLTKNCILQGEDF